MPIYEYRCKNCGTRLEVSQSFTDDPLTVCANCSGTLQRLIGKSATVIFKGSGFYVNDSRGKNPAASNGKSGNGSSESAPAAAPTSEKVATASEA
ncbi:MAG: zinc ribbon domain-containing protein [Anaerolineae bacterium]